MIEGCEGVGGLRVGWKQVAGGCCKIQIVSSNDSGTITPYRPRRACTSLPGGTPGGPESTKKSESIFLILFNGRQCWHCAQKISKERKKEIPDTFHGGVLLAWLVGEEPSGLWPAKPGDLRTSRLIRGQFGGSHGAGGCSHVVHFGSRPI